MAKTRIVAAILDTANLVLYKENGDEIIIPQGDIRVQRIVDEVTEPLSANGWADVELSYNNEEGNHFSDFEKQGSGVMKFFRIAKRFLKNIWDPATEAPAVEPVSLGVVPGTIKETAQTNKAESVPEKIRDATENQKPTLTSAVSQIMANAKSVSAPEFNMAEHNSQEDTIIAVVETANGPAVVPGMEHLRNQMEVASKLGSTVGVENFIKRVAAVIDQRGHSMMELLNFMKKGDLPIADDGSIIGYKVLRSTQKTISYHGSDPMPVPAKGYYVDCHSGRVLQRVGSLVQQENVDPSRRTQCSTGLHIARRQYLSGFSGDIITLVKIAPEDVIAVPEGEPNKMRARAYHILAEIPKDEHQRLRSNQPVEGMMAKRMLGMAIKGQHIDVIEDVVIGGPYGDKLKVTLRDTQGVMAEAPKVTKHAPVAAPLPDYVEDGDKPALTAPAVDAKAVSKAVTETKQTVSVPAPTADKPETRAEKVTRLVAVLRGKGVGNTKVDAARELTAIGKAAKKSLSKLGLTPGDEALVQQFMQTEPVAATSVKKEPAKATTPAEMRDRIDGVSEQLSLFKACKWEELYAFKKSKKKSWEKLGFNASQILTIEENNPTKK